MALDLSLARAQFPAITGPWIFMDNAGGSQVPLQVAEAVREYLLTTNVQHGATYSVSRQSRAAVDAGRQFVAEWIGAKGPEEVVFGQNSSQLLRMLALVLSSTWEPGDEVVITQAEHEANAGCWEYLEQFGIGVKTWEIDPRRYAFDLGRLTELLTDRTKLLAVHHSSNILGNVMPIKDIVNIAKGAGAMVCVDGVGYVPHRAVDVAALGADFYVFSLYKAFGPHLGALYGRADLLKTLPRWNHFFIEEDAIPDKLELGCGSYELAAGLTGLEKYFRAVGKNVAGPTREVVEGVYDGIMQHEAKLTRNLLGYLAGKRRVQIIGEADPRLAEDRVPVVSFVVEDADPEELVLEVDKARIGIRWGHFYAVRLLDALDLLQYKGVVRVSLAHYNTEAELSRLKEVLDPLVS
jgi:cysteine desulfurase family protein (TIGR01976 family)